MDQLILLYASSWQTSNGAPYLSRSSLPAFAASSASHIATHLHPSSSFPFCVWLNQCHFCCHWCLLCSVLYGVFCCCSPCLKSSTCARGRAGMSQNRAMLPNIKWNRMFLTIVVLTQIILHRIRQDCGIHQRKARRRSTHISNSICAG